MLKKIKTHVSDRGFTLMELLVVISIIGVLSSIVLALFSTTKKNAVNAAILNEVRSRETAINLFMEDSKRLYPNPDNYAGGSYFCFTKDVDCIFLGNTINGGAGLYAFIPQDNKTGNATQLASPIPAAPSLTINNYISPTKYTYGTVPIGGRSTLYSVGIFYRCISRSPNAVVSGAFDCAQANIYWVQVGTSICKKGKMLSYSSVNNNILCYESADGNDPYPHPADETPNVAPFD